jgi:hypothetical protein
MRHKRGPLKAHDGKHIYTVVAAGPNIRPNCHPFATFGVAASDHMRMNLPATTTCMLACSGTLAGPPCLGCAPRFVSNSRAVAEQVQDEEMQLVVCRLPVDCCPELHGPKFVEQHQELVVGQTF